MVFKNNILIPNWKKIFPELYCGFTTPYYKNMALTRTHVDIKNSLEENRKYFAQSIGISEKNIFSPFQTHSDNIIEVNYDSSGIGSVSIDKTLEGDACYTIKNNIFLMITWADCIPVIVCEPKQKMIAAVHSGWKSSKLNICGKLLINLQKNNGICPEDIYIGIGPGIRDCCYEVSLELLSKFHSYNYINQYVFQRNNKMFFDLSGFVLRQLVEAGVKEENIDFYGKCNSCNKDPEFYSCRREGKEHFLGQAAFIGWKS